MKNTLIDAGPLLALFNKNDCYHELAVDLLTWIKSDGSRDVG